MARPRYPRSDAPLPPPLPPEDRTVGQLVAETFRLYAASFWPAVLLGLPLAVADQLALGAAIDAAIVVLLLFAPAFTLAYAAAVRIATGVAFRPREWLTGVAVGTAVFVPAALVLPWFALLGFAWLALAGLVVPVALLEGAGPRTALSRAFRLGRADYVHALGGLATLAIVYFLTRFGLAFLLRDQGDQTERIAVFLADLVLSPVLYLGAVLLYDDQKARLIRSEAPRPPGRRRRRDADLHPADDADRPGGADAQVESRQATRGQP
jgi:hypothetical protein